MFVHTHRMYTPRENSNAHCRLLIMMCLCRFTDANKYTALLQDLDGGGGCMCWGRRWCMETMYFLLSFVVNLRLLKNFSTNIFFLNQTEFSAQFSQTCKSGYNVHLSVETLLPFIVTSPGSWPSPIHRNWLEAREEIQARFYGGLAAVGGNKNRQQVPLLAHCS